ncbi:medium-chain fatty acid-CoA ligase faa2 [Mucor velutinosus]|uniref:Medium-chain fatty acid-CoA ligase faa2 n=1 Tax=Mucor velutinosus TaxID=708070 RepID=A0AAN7HJQ7_9FUNG|nr:medium-chain fatty acid-CoA ligase faa2 [Mucor velutinosus]
MVSSQPSFYPMAFNELESKKVDQAQTQQMLPIWAIVIIIVVVIALVAVAVFYMKKHRSRSLSVDTIHRKEDEKKSMSTSSFQTLVTQKHKTLSPKSETSSSSITASLPQSLPSALPAAPSPAQASIAIAKKTKPTAATAITPQSNEKTDKPASDYNESDYTPPEPLQEIKISLPLPPPSTSFFSDKMELDGDDAQDFYDMYLNSKSKQDNSFISIDLDMPSFYSNVQQKAATIKSTLRQSLRVKQKSNRNSVQQLFSDEQYSSSGKSGEDAIVIVPLKQDSPKVVIDMNLPALSSAPSPLPPAEAPPPPQRQDINVITQSTANPSIQLGADESPITPNPNLQEPVRAAKRVIRSASRKTKTRSMVITDPTTTDLADDNDENGNGKRSKHGSIRYTSTRGPKSNGEHITITSGSMRRLVRESILFDEDALPLPSSAAIASSSHAAASSSIAATAPSAAKKSVVDIAGWWDTPKTSANTNSKPVVVVAATTEHVNENHLPLNITSGLDSISSNTPNQYRASLSASIFAGTLSKASGSNASLFFDLKDDTANHSNCGVSRYGSFRRGTLGRNTLRSITANATNGVNRSLKGLFDYSSSTSLSNKVVPVDSQKMELDSEPVMSIVESTVDVNVDPPQHLIRQKSVRTSTSSNSNRPAPPVSYLKTSESSTKYALTDDEDMEDKDESSKKTALDDMAHPESPTLPQGHYDLPSGSNKIEAASPSIAKLAENNFAQDSMPNSPLSSSTTHKGEVDTIRRMLQDTWITNMKESASNYSMLSETDSVATTSTQSTISSKLVPRQQQSLLSKSLLTQQVAKRASLLARHNGEEEFIPQQGPEPSASFSSSTVRTMVPANESAICSSLSSEPIAIRQNAISSKMHGSNKIQESSYDDKPPLMNRFSTSPMTDVSAISSPRNSSAESSRGHSRKSSGGNSAATALRISSGYSANAKTWNGRALKRTNKPSVTQQGFVSPDDSLGRSSVNKKFFSTMRKGQKTRGNIPWMMEEESSQEKTPAQIERDRYLEGGSIL